jgi:hypothetical protein
MAGIAPATTQYLASLANQLLLPAPAPTNHFPIGFTLKVSTHIANEALDQDQLQETDSIILIS